MSENITHTGIVEKIEKDSISVRIIQQSACSECHAQGMCSASEKKEKIIDFPDHSGKFRVNEEVMISGESSLGLKAVLLAFVIPVIIVVIAIVAGTEMHWKDTVSGLTGLLFLVPYYCILYFLRDKLKKQFIFTLKKLK